MTLSIIEVRFALDAALKTQAQNDIEFAGITIE